MSTALHLIWPSFTEKSLSAGGHGASPSSLFLVGSAANVFMPLDIQFSKSSDGGKEKVPSLCRQREDDFHNTIFKVYSEIF
jgi:hypothetical protein